MSFSKCFPVRTEVSKVVDRDRQQLTLLISETMPLGFRSKEKREVASVLVLIKGSALCLVFQHWVDSLYWVWGCEMFMANQGRKVKSGHTARAGLVHGAFPSVWLTFAAQGQLWSLWNLWRIWLVSMLWSSASGSQAFISYLETI